MIGYSVTALLMIMPENPPVPKGHCVRHLALFGKVPHDLAPKKGRLSCSPASCSYSIRLDRCGFITKDTKYHYQIFLSIGPNTWGVSRIVTLTFRKVLFVFWIVFPSVVPLI